MEASRTGLAEFARIWDDQAAFNRQLRPPPSSAEEAAQQTKDFVLYTESELHELLRTYLWKAHRRTEDRNNPAHRHEECADVFKCVISLCQIQGMTLDDLVAAYWRKTAVVKQRYQEEWIHKLNRPCAIVDIDNVLCDYIRGMCQWIRRRQSGQLLMAGDPRSGLELDCRLHQIETDGTFINAQSLGINPEIWQRLKHEFRTTGAKRRLPVFPDAFPFLQALRNRNLQIILLTSRPVARYPNLYTDTLEWLNQHQLPFDFIWWADDKAERVVESDVRPLIRMVVDDDERFVRQYARIGIHSYWLQRRVPSTDSSLELVHRVRGLQQVVDHYDERIRQEEAASWQSTQTQSIDPTPSIPANNPPQT